MATQWKLRTIVAAVGMALIAPVVVAKTTGQAQATANSSQKAAGSFDFTKGSTNSATINRHVLQNATGNIGANIAAGDANMQGNNTDIALANGALTKKTSTSSLVENTQWGNVFSLSLSADVTNNASASNHVLQNASGNIGLNVASGADNMQANGLAATDNNAGKLATAAIDNDQGTEGFHGNRARLSFTGGSSNNAYLNDKVLQDASGNVGANVAAGAWNEQANNLSIAYAAGPVASTTTATAAIADNQASNMAFYLPSVAFDKMGAMTASLSNDVLQNATGNIGVNVASGLQNVQANNTALAYGWGVGNGDMDGDNTGGPATAVISGVQSSGPYSIAVDKGANNAASVSNHVLQNAAGNIGANVAAGLQNMQSNDLAYAFNQAGSNASAMSKVSQVSMGAIATDTPVSFSTGGDNDGDNSVSIPTMNTASVGNHVMQDAAGNVGLNVAAGAANMQRNTLTIADAD